MCIILKNHTYVHDARRFYKGPRFGPIRRSLYFLTVGHLVWKCSLAPGKNTVLGSTDSWCSLPLADIKLFFYFSWRELFSFGHLDLGDRRLTVPLRQWSFPSGRFELKFRSSSRLTPTSWHLATSFLRLSVLPPSEASNRSWSFHSVAQRGSFWRACR